MPNDMELLARVYERFNARDIDGVLAFLHGDVVWANGQDGGYVQGHAGVRSYWGRQWTTIDPQVEPVRFSSGADGEVVVEVHQVVRAVDGTLLGDKRVLHVFHIEDSLIRRFDIRAIGE
jgi:hypothetical protein